MNKYCVEYSILNSTLHVQHHTVYCTVYPIRYTYVSNQHIFTDRLWKLLVSSLKSLQSMAWGQIQRKTPSITLNNILFYLEYLFLFIYSCIFGLSSWKLFIDVFSRIIVMHMYAYLKLELWVNFDHKYCFWAYSLELTKTDIFDVSPISVCLSFCYQ